MTALLEPLDAATRSPVTGVRRWCYMALGLAFVGLAILGVVLPVLPTTPFLLLASFFFVRSSPRLHGWLLRSRLFGPFLRDWHRHRGVRLHVKIIAVVMISLAVAASAYFGSLPWFLIALLVLLGLIGMTVVLRLPLVRDLPEKAAEIGEDSGQPGPLAADPLQAQEA